MNTMPFLGVLRRFKRTVRPFLPMALICMIVGVIPLCILVVCIVGLDRLSLSSEPGEKAVPASTARTVAALFALLVTLEVALVVTYVIWKYKKDGPSPFNVIKINRHLGDHGCQHAQFESQNSAIERRRALSESSQVREEQLASSGTVEQPESTKPDTITTTTQDPPPKTHIDEGNQINANLASSSKEPAQTQLPGRLRVRNYSVHDNISTTSDGSAKTLDERQDHDTATASVALPYPDTFASSPSVPSASFTSQLPNVATHELEAGWAKNGPESSTVRVGCHCLCCACIRAGNARGVCDGCQACKTCRHDCF